MLNFFPEGSADDAIANINQGNPDAELHLSLEQPDQLENRPDLTLWMYEEKQNTPSILKGIWRYRTDLFDKNSVENISSDFQTLLTEMCTHPDRKIGELSFQPTKNKKVIYS